MIVDVCLTNVCLPAVYWAAAYCIVFNTGRNLRCVTKADVLASHLCSIINTYLYLATENLSTLLAYYLYDSILCIIKSNWFFLFHHIITVYMITFPPGTIQHAVLMPLLYYNKSADVTVHYKTILECTTADGKTVQWIKFLSMLSTFFLYSYFRIWYQWTHFNWSLGWEISLFSLFIWSAGFWWTYKVARICYKMSSLKKN